MFWWGITLLILLAIFQFAAGDIARNQSIPRIPRPQRIRRRRLMDRDGLNGKKAGSNTKLAAQKWREAKMSRSSPPARRCINMSPRLSRARTSRCGTLIFGPDFPTRNRCSYSANGASVPIYGEPGKVTRPRFRHDLPFPICLSVLWFLSFRMRMGRS